MGSLQCFNNRKGSQHCKKNLHQLFRFFIQISTVIITAHIKVMIKFPILGRGNSSLSAKVNDQKTPLHLKTIGTDGDLLGMCRSSNSNVVAIRQFFCNPKSDGFSETFTSNSDFRLSFWKAFLHHSSQSVISHANLNNQAENSYLTGTRDLVQRRARKTTFSVHWCTWESGIIQPAHCRQHCTLAAWREKTVDTLSAALSWPV